MKLDIDLNKWKVSVEDVDFDVENPEDMLCAKMLVITAPAMYATVWNAVNAETEQERKEKLASQVRSFCLVETALKILCRRKDRNCEWNPNMMATYLNKIFNSREDTSDIHRD